MSFGGVLKGFPDLMSFVMFCCKFFTILRIDNFLVFYETNFCFGRKWIFLLSTNFCDIWILNSEHEHGMKQCLMLWRSTEIKVLTIKKVEYCLSLFRCGY